MVASTCPAVTVSPASTFTAVTVPAAEKLSSSVWAAATVPSAETVSLRVPLVTVTSCREVVVADAVESSDERKANHQTPNATTTTIGPATKGFRRRADAGARRNAAKPGMRRIDAQPT